MFTNSQIARVLRIQKIPYFLIVDLPSLISCEYECGLTCSYLYVRNLDDETDVQILRMTFITLSK